jgi:hypothetical protein
MCFLVGVGGRKLCAFQLEIWWWAVMCPFGGGLVTGSCLPFWKGVCGRKLCVFLFGVFGR